MLLKMSKIKKTKKTCKKEKSYKKQGPVGVIIISTIAPKYGLRCSALSITESLN